MAANAGSEQNNELPLLRPYKQQQEQQHASTTRTAFNLLPVHMRRDASRITAVAMDSQAQRVFLGLSTGQIEEHQVLSHTPRHSVPSAGGDATPTSSYAGGGGSVCSVVGAPSLHVPPAAQAPSLRLVAGRRVSRHGVLELCCLPSVSRLVAICGDGSVVVSPYDGAALWVLPKVKHAVALAGDGTRRVPARLAVVVRASSGLAGLDSRTHTTGGKLYVFSIAPAGPPGKSSLLGGQPALELAQVPIEEPVHAAAWVGDAVFLATASGYKLARRGGGSTGATVVDIAPNPGGVPMIGPPYHGDREALLLFGDRMVVVTDSQGAAVCAPLLLPDRPLLLASLGWGAQSPNNHHSASPFAQSHTASPAVATAAGGAHIGSSSSSSVISNSYNASRVLSNGDAASVKSDGASNDSLGAGVAMGGAMYVVGMVDAGVCVMHRQSGRRLQFIPFAHDDAWIQAAQRMPCVTDWASGSLLLATSSTLLWLQPVPIEAQVHQLLRHHQYPAAQELIDSCEGRGCAWTDVARAQLALLQMQVLCFGQACTNLLRVPPQVFQPAQLLSLFPVPMAHWIPSAPCKRFWGIHHHHAQKGLEELVDDWLEMVLACQPPPLPATGPPSSNNLQLQHQQQQQQQQQQQLQLHLTRAWALCSAKQHLVSYLQAVRARPGVVLQDALDTLLLLLLCEVGKGNEVETFAAAPNAVSLQHVLPLLKAGQRWRALALLWASHSHYQDALDVWEGLSQGTLTEAPAAPSTGSVVQEGHVGDGHIASGNTAKHAAKHAAVGGPISSGADGGLPAALNADVAAWGSAAKRCGADFGAGSAGVGGDGGVSRDAQIRHEAAVAAAVFMSRPSEERQQQIQQQQQQLQQQSPLERRRSGAVAHRALSLQPQRSTGLQQQQQQQLQQPPPAQQVAHITLYPPGYPHNQQQQQQQQQQKELWGLLPPSPSQLQVPFTPFTSKTQTLDPCFSLHAPQGEFGATEGCSTHVSGVAFLHAFPPPLPLPAWMLPDNSAAALNATNSQAHLQQQNHHQQQQQQQLQLAQHNTTQAHTDAPSHAHTPLPPPSPDFGSPQSPFVLGDITHVTHHTLHVPAPVPTPSTPVAPDIVLGKLAWLLDVAPLEAMRVIRGRAADLPPEGMLAILANRSNDARFLYLHELVHVHGLSDVALQTELALELVECFARDAKACHFHPPENLRAPHKHSDDQPPMDTQLHEFVSNPTLDANPAEAPACRGSNRILCREVAQLSKHTRGLLDVLRAHLATSQLYDARIALAAVHDALADLSAAEAAAAAASRSPECVAKEVGWAAAERDGAAGFGDRRRDGLEMGTSGSSCLGGLQHGDVQNDVGGTSDADEDGRDSVGDDLWDGEEGGVVERCFEQRSSSMGEGYFEGRSSGKGVREKGRESPVGAAQVQLLHVEVLLLQRLGLHEDALRVLVLRLRDVDAAIMYCKQQQLPMLSSRNPTPAQAPFSPLHPHQQQHAAQGDGGSGDVSVEAGRLWLLLLEMCLRPGPEAQPSYAGALKVLDAQQAACGAHGSLLLLDPQWVLNALGDDMPLHLAAPTLSRMLCALGHRRRQAQVLRGLHRTQNLTSRAERALLCCQHVVVDEATLCSLCHAPIGDHIFARTPSGAIVCGRCASKPVVEQAVPRQVLL